MLASPQAWLGNRGGPLSSSSAHLSSDLSGAYVPANVGGMHGWNREHAGQGSSMRTAAAAAADAAAANQSQNAGGQGQHLHSLLTNPAGAPSSTPPFTATQAWPSGNDTLPQQQQQQQQAHPGYTANQAAPQYASPFLPSLSASVGLGSRGMDAGLASSEHAVTGSASLIGNPHIPPHEYGRPHTADKYASSSSRYFASTPYGQPGPGTGSSGLPGLGGGGSNAFNASQSSPGGPPSGYPPGPLPSSSGSGAHYTFGSGGGGGMTSASMPDSPFHAQSSFPSSFAHQVGAPASSGGGGGNVERDIHSSSSSHHPANPYLAGSGAAIASAPAYMQSHSQSSQHAMPSHHYDVHNSFYGGGGASGSMGYQFGGGSGPYHSHPHHDAHDHRILPFFNPFEVKHRRRTTRSQFKVLENTFLETPKPSAATRKAISEQLDMPLRAVQIWFQNRRAKAKTQAKRGPNANMMAGPASGSKGGMGIPGGGGALEEDEVQTSPVDGDSPSHMDGQLPLSSNSTTSFVSTGTGLQSQASRIKVSGLAGAPHQASSSSYDEARPTPLYHSSFSSASSSEQPGHSHLGFNVGSNRSSGGMSSVYDSSSFKLPAGRPQQTNVGAYDDRAGTIRKPTTPVVPSLPSPQQHQHQSAFTQHTFAHQQTHPPPPPPPPQQQQQHQQGGGGYEYTTEERKQGQSHWPY